MLDYIFWPIIITIIAKIFVKDNLRRGYKFSIVLGIWIILKLLNYIAIVELIKIYYAPFKGFSDYPEVDTLKYVLLGVAVADFGFIYFIRRIIVKKLQEGDLRREEIVVRLLFLSFIIYALCESIAIYGLVLFLMAGNSLNFYIFLILCFVCLGIYFPKYGQWESLAKRERNLKNKGGRETSDVMVNKFRCKECGSLIAEKSLKWDKKQVCPYCGAEDAIA